MQHLLYVIFPDHAAAQVSIRLVGSSSLKHALSCVVYSYGRVLVGTWGIGPSKEYGAPLPSSLTPCCGFSDSLPPPPQHE